MSRRRKEVSGGYSKHFIYNYFALDIRPSREIVKSDPDKSSMPASSQIEVKYDLDCSITLTVGGLFSKLNHSSTSL